MTEHCTQDERVITAQAAINARERADGDALSLVGAVIDRLRVTGRFHTGRRWQYAVEDLHTGRTGAMRGYELVRAARAARTNGLTVTMPGPGWRDEG